VRARTQPSGEPDDVNRPHWFEQGQNQQKKSNQGHSTRTLRLEIKWTKGSDCGNKKQKAKAGSIGGLVAKSGRHWNFRAHLQANGSRGDKEACDAGDEKKKQNVKRGVLQVQQAGDQNLDANQC